MAKTRAWWLVAASIPFLLAAARCKPREAAAPVAPPVRAVADIKQLMTGVIDPGADVVWESVAVIISKEGTEERRPRTDEEWAAVRNAAVQLTEGGNLLMLGDRARDHQAWWAMSRALVDAGAVALQAAERKDANALLEAGEGITATCDSCHAAYWTDARSLR